MGQGCLCIGITVIYYLRSFLFSIFTSVFYIDVDMYISDVLAVYCFSFNMLCSVISEYIAAGHCYLGIYPPVAVLMPSWDAGTEPFDRTISDDMWLTLCFLLLHLTC